MLPSESYTPINCRSSIEGVFQFTYQYRFVSTGICTKPEQRIHSCQNIGSQFLISNQKFNVTYKKCDGMEWTKDAVVEYRFVQFMRVDTNITNIFIFIPV